MAVPESSLRTWQPFAVFSGGAANQPYDIVDWKLRSHCSRFAAGNRLALGFTLYNSLYEQASNSTSLSVAFDLTSAVITLPIHA